MDWEEKVYDLKQEIRERDAESLDNLSDSVLTALENRYEAMLEAEQQRLDESRKTWEKWRDDSVAAIEDQIAALDKLADTEDREKQDAEDYAANLGEKWGLGRNDMILLLVKDLLCASRRPPYPSVSSQP